MTSCRPNDILLFPPSGEHTFYTRFKCQCRNVSILTCSGVRLALLLEAMSPDAGKSRSEGVEVAGIHKNDLASEARAGSLASFNFHQDRGLSVFERGCSPKYISTSLLIICLCASSCSGTTPLPENGQRERERVGERES